MISKLNSQLIMAADKIRDTTKHPEIEECDNAFTNELGGKLADILKLRRDPDHKNRWQTMDGNKTNIGLARTVIRILEESL